MIQEVTTTRSTTMIASYFYKYQGHSASGKRARQRGAVAWSKLPHRLRRQLTSDQAHLLGISDECHPCGKFAVDVHVYYPEAVTAFWDVVDTSGYTVDDILKAVAEHRTITPTTSHRNVARIMAPLRVMAHASLAASTVANDIRLRHQ